MVVRAAIAPVSIEPRQGKGRFGPLSIGPLRENSRRPRSEAAHQAPTLFRPHSLRRGAFRIAPVDCRCGRMQNGSPERAERRWPNREPSPATLFAHRASSPGLAAPYSRAAKLFATREKALHETLLREMSPEPAVDNQSGPDRSGPVRPFPPMPFVTQRRRMPASARNGLVEQPWSRCGIL